jgi:hypothetical protein
MLSSTSLHTIYSNKSADAFSLFLLYIFIYCEEEEEKEVVLKERGRDGGSMGPILLFILTGTTTLPLVLFLASAMAACSGS